MSNPFDTSYYSTNKDEDVFNSYEQSVYNPNSNWDYQPVQTVPIYQLYPSNNYQYSQETNTNPFIHTYTQNPPPINNFQATYVSSNNAKNDSCINKIDLVASFIFLTYAAAAVILALTVKPLFSFALIALPLALPLYLYLRNRGETEPRNESQFLNTSYQYPSPENSLQTVYNRRD